MNLQEPAAAAATADKSLQSCPTLCDPIDGSPPGSSFPGILQARVLEWVAIAFPAKNLSYWENGGPIHGNMEVRRKSRLTCEWIQASLVVQMVKILSAMQETVVRSLGWEDPLEEDLGTHSIFLVWRIPTDRGAWQATVHGVAKSGTQLSDDAHTHLWIRWVWEVVGSLSRENLRVGMWMTCRDKRSCGGDKVIKKNLIRRHKSTGKL